MVEIYEEEQKEFQYDTTLWAMTLATLFSIILAFFVLLYAYSSPSFNSTKATVEAVKNTFSNKAKKQEGVSKEIEFTLPPDGAEVALQQYYADTKKYVMQELQIDETSIIEKGNTLIFRLPVDLLFEKGTAQIDDKRLFLQRMADGLTQQPVGRQLAVEFKIGRDYATAKDRLPLSVLRAGAFARKLTSLGVSEDVLYTGVGEGDPQFFNITFSPQDETRSRLEF